MNCNKKRIFVATYFDWSNYGAMLQAISFNHYLNNMGSEAFLINYKQEDIFPQHLSWKSKILSWFYYRSNKRRKKAGETFVHNNARMTQLFSNFDQLKSLDEENNVFISGSDQVWHPGLCSPFFFLKFVSRGIKASYGASLGAPLIPSCKHETIKQYLHDFTQISCRERSAKKLLLPLIGDHTEVQVHIDPVFLNEEEYWSKLEEPVFTLPKRYVLVYAIYWNWKLNDMLKKLHEDTKLPVVVVGQAPKTFANIRISDATPGQFLYLIRNAVEVVSSSFHGVVFSILYNKKCHAILNPTAPDRIKDMLGVFFPHLNTDKNTIIINHDDYGQYQQVLSCEKEKARNYLSSLLL